MQLPWVLILLMQFQGGYCYSQPPIDAAHRLHITEGGPADSPSQSILILAGDDAPGLPPDETPDETSYQNHHL